MVEQAPSVGDVTKTLFGIFLEARLNQREDRARYDRPVRIFAHNADDQVRDWVPGEGAPAADHFVEDASKRPDVGTLVEAGENVVSVASYWEVVIKTQKGSLSISDLATWWRRATELTSARILHIRPSHITAFAGLPMLHKDPFDRILIAQARTEDLRIVTSDGHISEYSIQTIW